MEKLKEVFIKHEIPIPNELKSIMRPGTKVTMRIERFGLVVRPKIDPIDDMIGSLSVKKRVDVEKELDERFEYAEEV